MIEEKELLSLEEAMAEVHKRVERLLRTAPIVIRSYTRHLASSPGKGIRARGLLVAAMNERGEVPGDGIILAASLEILHLATLVHDDVMDGAKLRRGISTLAEEYGRKTAVICGDYLLTLALQTAAAAKRPEEWQQILLPDYMGRLCMGELKQHRNSWNLDLDLFRYLDIIHGKTAALFEAAFYAGALLTGKEGEYKNYRRLGNYVGMIFQLTDDCIDYEAGEPAARKSVQSDYEQGVITLPLIYALGRRKEWKEEIRRNRPAGVVINGVVRQAGGLSFTREIAGRYFEKAVRLLGRMDLEAQKRALLAKILEKAYYGLKVEADEG